MAAAAFTARQQKHLYLAAACTGQVWVARLGQAGQKVSPPADALGQQGTSAWSISSKLAGLMGLSLLLSMKSKA